MAENPKRFTISLYNNTSKEMVVAETSILMGQWAPGELPKEKTVIRAGTVGGPWQMDAIDETGVGGLVALKCGHMEVVLHWLLLPDGKKEIQFIGPEFEKSSERLEEVEGGTHVIWRFSVDDKAN